MQLALNLSRAYTNRQLFSGHFLEQRLRAEALWQEVADEADRVRGRLRSGLREQEAALRHANERQTEERWIIPVLRELRWGLEFQPQSRRQGTTLFPDYGLFPDQPSADAAAALEDVRQVLKRAVGILEAKRWGRGLDARGAPDDESGQRVPSMQIVNYLVRAEQPWGILTDGQEWRLYTRDADFADTVYFSVDLPALLGDEPLALGERGESIEPAQAFRYFYLFFRPAAFVPRDGGARWLDDVRAESLEYARAVEEALKPRAYRAVEALCRGFLAADGRGPAVAAAAPDLGAEVLDNALTLLFRLLFILYAEARDLLPVHSNPAYRRKSLLELRRRAAQQRDEGEPVFPLGRDFWDDLHQLFAIIDGDPQWSGLGIPVYDGGLFDPAKHHWLEDHYVPDPQLAEAIDLLSRVEEPRTSILHQVDYGPLDVRQLGSIYEGLLEHVLRVADADLPEIRESGVLVRGAVRQRELYLANDKGERKITGSFYTPEYIVQYIVEKALGPLVEGLSAEQILGLRVLDPAMGSGHFLVSATAYLARAAVRAVAEGDQHLLGDFALLDPDHLRRLVVERCIFGVDRNPRAVELAKLSLWLATVQSGKALNFLDHHLKCGDSLLGARMAELGRLPGKGRLSKLEAAGQYNAFQGAFQAQLIGTLALLHQIEFLPSDTEAQVQQKDGLYREADQRLDRFRQTANVWYSRFFGNVFDGDAYGRVLDALQAPAAAWHELASAPWFARGQEVAQDHRFFHWSIEFAETFYQESGQERENPGFDAVIGNPPYVRMEAFKEIKDALRAEYTTYQTRADLYVYFIERSLELLRRAGEYGVIVSNKFLRANYGKPLRAFLGRVAGVREIADFAGLPVFPGATVRPAIVLLRKGAAGIPARFAELASLRPERLALDISACAHALDPNATAGEDWALASADVAAVLRRLEAGSVPLGEHVDRRICWGVKTGLNDAFFLDGEVRRRLIEEDPRSEEVIKPLVVGDDVRRYRIDRHDRWLLYLPHGVDIAQYPAVERHLARFRERLEARATIGSHAWYELQQPQEAYQDYFEGAKIVYPEIAPDSRFGLDAGPLYPNNKCFFIPVDDAALLALLNSRAAFCWLEHTAARLEGPSGGTPYIELRAQYMERLPIPAALAPAAPTNALEHPPEARHARAELGAWLRTLYFRGLRQAGIEPEVPEDIRGAGERLAAVSGVRRVVLVGSWARGEAREDSDVDLVVVREDGRGGLAQHRELRRALRGFGRAVDLMSYTPAEYAALTANPAGTLAHMLGEGIVLYERP